MQDLVLLEPPIKYLMDIGKMSEPVIVQNLGVVSKELDPVVNIRQLQNIIDTIGQNLENGELDNPMISFIGDRTTGFYYDANEGNLYGVSKGVKVFSFNQNGLAIYAPFIQTYQNIEVTGNNVSNANLITEGITTLMPNSTGNAVQLSSNLSNGACVYIRNLTGNTVSIYPTAGDSFYGLNENQSVDILNNQFICIRCSVDSSTNTKTYYGNVFAGLDANGDAVFQNLAVEVSATLSGSLTVENGGSIELKKANLTNESGYMGVSCVGDLSVNSTTGITASYQFNVITESEPNGIVYLPPADQVANGATIYIKNVTENNILLYPPSGQSIESNGKDTPINIAPKSGGSFTYVNGYLSHHILLSTKPDGNVIMPGSNAYSTFTQQEPLISYGSNQSNETGTVTLKDQIIYIDNQYIDVDTQNGTATSVTSSSGGTENVTYNQNFFQLSEEIPTGTFLLLTPNYYWANTNNNTNSTFFLQCDSNSVFVTNIGVTLPNGGAVEQQIELSPNYCYLLIKTQNQWGNAIWIVTQLGMYNEGNFVLGNITQSFQDIICNGTLNCQKITATSLNCTEGIECSTLNLSYTDIQVNIGNTQSGSLELVASSAAIVYITEVEEGSNALTIVTEQSGGETIDTFILSNQTGSEVIIFPQSSGYINQLPVNESYTLGAYESVIVTGYLDDNADLHLSLIGLGLSDKVKTTSQFISALPTNTGIEVSGELEVTGGNINAQNVITTQNVQVGGLLVKSYAYGVVAQGTDQSTATVLDSIVNVVTQASGLYCVKAQANLDVGTCLEIYNRSGQTIKIYPANGEQIELFNQNDFCLLANNSSVKMTLIEENSRRMWITAVIGSPISQTGDS